MTCNGKPVVSGRGGGGGWGGGGGGGGIIESALSSLVKDRISVDAFMTPFHSIQIPGMNWNVTIRNWCFPNHPW